MSVNASAAGALRRLWPFVRPNRRLLGPIVIGLLIDAGFDGFWPIGFKLLIDDALVPHDKRVLVYVLVALGGGVVVTALVQVGYDLLYARLCAGTLAEVRLAMFDRLQQLSLDFHGRVQAGDLLSRFSGDLVAVENALVAAPPWAAKPALDVLASSVLLFVLDWRLAAGAMLVWPVALLGPRYFAPRALSASYDKRQLEAGTLSVVQESFAGLPVVKAFSLERPRRAVFQEPLAALRRSTRGVVFVGRLVERSSLTGVLVLGIGLIGVGAWMVFSGQMTIGTLVAFQSLFFTLGYSIANLTQYVPSLVQGLGGFERVGELLDERPGVVDEVGAAQLPPFGDEIAFDDVAFTYPAADTPSLTGLDLRIRRGDSVALVGMSGSGKSTAVNLLLRFYDPDAGSVAIDGRDLREVSQESLRSQIGVVFQESFLFDTTIRENIRLGRPGASDADVEAAARAAEVHDFVCSLPKGYDTVVGERGGRLSGGQRQRIAIARAIVRDPAILVLDEATSALDPATEAALNVTLARLAKGRTTIAVTHRLAAARDARRLVVLDRGRIAERGTHDELVAAGGLYRELWERQSGFLIREDGAEVTAERLARLPILSALARDLLEDAAALFGSEHVPAGRTVVQEGDPGDRFYLVVRGRLVVLHGDKRVAVLEDGDHFGEIALLRRVPRTATVRAELPSLLLSLAHEHFDALLERAPGVRVELERLADERLAMLD